VNICPGGTALNGGLLAIKVVYVGKLWTLLPYSSSSFGDLPAMRS
jgi:hypothetical protein